MKKILTKVSTTINAFKLFTNPEVQRFIVNKLDHEIQTNNKKQLQLNTGKNDLFFHKYFIVQVVN